MKLNSSVITTLQQERSQHEVYPPATEADIKETEIALGVRLPESYCKFVSEFSNGAYLYRCQEISAVGQGNQQIGALQHTYRPWTAGPHKVDDGQPIPIREGGYVTVDQLIPFAYDHNGNMWCFIVEKMQDHEYRVGYYDKFQPKLYGVMDSFHDWLNVCVSHREEVIRAIFDDDVIVHELGLG
ncbi:hypothetical protein GNP94_02895 [Paenibacillus campinasensis]|uniref:Knr4/Smi1-like domain-containing protein n=1 Tax=Paenibacillus campinasensis TaxID=66347 RepID=A0ABW9SZU4_9BACL|nr:SMI1/KNR4 family protein [Paenibacillus campinasensis]MUG64951.1 hypothetical protein [Paenibacillus campinasensis]